MKNMFKSNILPIDFLNNLQTMIYISDVDSCEILFINNRMKEEFGFGDDCLGQICFGLFEGGRGKNCKHCYVEKEVDENFLNCTWDEYNSKTKKYYRNTDSFVKWKDDKMVHLREMRDVTDENIMQNKIKDLNSTLARGQNVKSDFLTRMTRNVNLPINTIKGLTSIANSTIDVRKIKQCLKKIDTETNKLSDYMTGVFDMSKIDQDKFEFVNEPFSFENMLIDVSNKTSDKCTEKNQIFQIKMDMEMPTYFVGDELRISQVMTNILDNAVECTPEGGKIQIDICQITLMNNISTIEISISDTGYGMDKEKQDIIYKLFEEEDLNKIVNYEKVGLGLPLSKSIVQRLRGKIHLYSSTNFGTTIAFTIKLEVFDSRFFERKLSPGLNIKNLNVLFLDSSFEVCEYFRKIMKGFKINSDTTTTYLGFTEKLENAVANEKPYNLIFLEENNTDMNTVTIVKQIKHKFENTNIIVVTKDALIDKELMKQVGITKFITKPMFPSQLLDTINEIVTIPNKGQTSYRSKKFDFYGKNILLVEDISINQEIMKKVLKETKVKISCAKNGLIAIEMFKSDYEKYDLILMDINMPEMNGIDATKQIRLMPFEKAKKIPIIALTANISDRDKEDCKNAGMNNHIPKPIEPEYLLEKLAQYLPKKEMPETVVDMEKYIDIQEAITRVGGNIKVYKALLNNFSKKMYFEDLKYEIMQKNFENAYKIAHTIKGVAANLSLVEVYCIMNVVEHELFDGKNTDSSMSEAEVIFVNTLKSINQYLFTM